MIRRLQAGGKLTGNISVPSAGAPSLRCVATECGSALGHCTVVNIDGARGGVAAADAASVLRRVRTWPCHYSPWIGGTQPRPGAVGWG